MHKRKVRPIKKKKEKRRKGRKNKLKKGSVKQRVNIAIEEMTRIVTVQQSIFGRAHDQGQIYKHLMSKKGGRLKTNVKVSEIKKKVEKKDRTILHIATLYH